MRALHLSFGMNACQKPQLHYTCSRLIYGQPGVPRCCSNATHICSIQHTIKLNNLCDTEVLFCTAVMPVAVIPSPSAMKHSASDNNTRFSMQTMPFSTSQTSNGVPVELTSKKYYRQPHQTHTNCDLPSGLQHHVENWQGAVAYGCTDVSSVRKCCLAFQGTIPSECTFVCNPCTKV